MFNKNRPFHPSFLLALALAVLPLPGRAQSVEVYGLGGVPVDFGSPPANPHPVLFVHGHNLLNENLVPNYKNNWVNRLCDLPSFDQALIRNPGLAIEPYYLRMCERRPGQHQCEQHRSIDDDARKIARAVDLVLHRHDPSYDLSDSGRSTHARVALIAMSRGTISSRLYLKWLRDYSAAGCDRSRDLPCVGPGFYPVSELIAIAPPNHGLSSAITVVDSEALQQLNNGYDESCKALAKGLDFIENLNGHSICDTFGEENCSSCLCPTVHATPEPIYPTEAPLSREPEAPLREGVLYLTLFAENGDDELVGGDQLSDDCQGRRLALNLSPHAVNVPLPKEKVGLCLWPTHSLTVHWPETICRAFYTAAHHRVPEDPSPCEAGADDVPVIPAPAPIDAVLALDLSGSMAGQPCPTCDPKVEVLRQAVELFIRLWGVVARPQDRIGAVYFRTAASGPVGGEALGPVATHGQTIVDDLTAQPPSGWTAMGGAMHSAIGTLSDPPPIEGASRHVIVFTDGMQNRNPMVLDDGGLRIADDPSRRPLPSGLPPVDLENLADVKVHTIGIGAGDAANELLNKIAERTGGRFQSSLDLGVLKRFFVEKVIDVMRGFSPQLVDYRRGSTRAGDYVAQTFTIDGAARRVIFAVSFPRGGELDLRVGKDGAEITDRARLVSGPFYRILTFDPPLEVDRTTIESAGDWQLFLRSLGPSPELAYEIWAIVDGVELHHQASLGEPPHVAGRPLRMTVELRAGSQPVTGAGVSARVLRSPTALGTLLATTPMPRNAGPVLEPGTTGGQRKLQALLVRKEVWPNIQPVEALGARVELTDQGDGTYRGSFDHTSIPGTYNVVFDIRATDAEGREVRRSETLSAQVEVGELLLPDLVTKVRVVDGQLKLTLRPRDRYGNYLGPDYGDRIRVALASGPAAPVVDRLDGGYEIAVPLPAGGEQNLELEVLGRRLFAGTVSQLRRSARSSRWVFSAHLGYALPAGPFNRLYDPGPLVELALERALSVRFALRGVLGRYRLDPDFDVDGATLYLRTYRPWESFVHRPGTTWLFAEIGPGVYDPEGLGSTAGLSVGFGVCREFRPRLESELGASYFHLFTPGDDLRFVALKAGLRVSF